MKFEEALSELNNGKLIKRKYYHDWISLKSMANTLIMIGDILQDDWEVQEEPGKTFPEVFEAFKEGKYVRRKEWATDNYLPYKRLNSETLAFQFSPKDLLASDWEIIE